MNFKRAFWLLLAFASACTFSQKIKDGETAFNRMQYAVATRMLEEEYNASRNEQAKARKAYLLGKSYTRLQEYRLAAEWYEKAAKADYGPEAWGNLGEIYMMAEEYDKAATTYEMIRQKAGSSQDIDRKILICRQAKANKSKPLEWFVERMPENSEVSDYSPVLYEKDYIVFSSERINSTGKDVYNWTGEKYSDIYIMLKGGSEARKFDSNINTDENEGSVCFTSDMNRIYFTRCTGNGIGDDHCKIYYSDRINEVWSEPVLLPFIRDKINYGQPALIEKDSVLIFSADIVQPGGTKDLYYSELYADGNWSEPDLLPSTINSPGNEMFPTADADTLYFSSDYLPGFGGLDIFRTYLRKDRSWTPAENLGYGINSGGDDFSFMPDRESRAREGVLLQGYFSSSRQGSAKDDIYRFLKIMIKEVSPVDTVPLAPTVKQLYVTVKTKTPVYNTPDDPNSGVAGYSPLPKTLIKITESGGKKIAEEKSDANGFYLSEIPVNTNLIVLGAYPGYLNASREIKAGDAVFKPGENSVTINVELVLDKIYLEKEVNLENIYYDYDKWDIRPDARPTLDKLARILKDNPQINIQLSSHTDCRGSDDYNIELSQKRAQSVVNYLSQSGIDGMRLVAVGYGESFLIDTCACETCSEDQHLKNRRTTFKILKK